MCYVYTITFCKGNINTYINFESISSVTYFFMYVYWIRFFLVSQFIYIYIYRQTYRQRGIVIEGYISVLFKIPRKNTDYYHSAIYMTYSYLTYQTEIKV